MATIRIKIDTKAMPDTIKTTRRKLTPKEINVRRTKKALTALDAMFKPILDQKTL